MNALAIAILAFIILESLNVIILYFAPGTKKGNGVGVFNAYEKAKQDSEIFPFVKYLINWVAGTKLIFIVLLIVALIFGNEQVKLYSVIALIISILTFYWRLYPIIRKMDENGQLNPKGYSKTLGVMIAVILIMFSAVLLVYLFL